jgi:RNA polymerase sigma-70 factor (sigma-E family)
MRKSCKERGRSGVWSPVVTPVLPAERVPMRRVMAVDQTAVEGEHLEHDDFVALYEASFDEMVRLAFLLVGSQEIARDVVQDSFVKLHRAWVRADNPHAYLRRIVVNECTTHHRRRFRHLRVQSMLVATDSINDQPDEISDALAALPERQRAAIVLRYWHDCSENEIAAILDCRPGTVGSLLHRGIAELRRVIEP